MPSSFLTLSFLIGGLAPVLGAYLLGSVPFGLVIAKTVRGIDPRLAGSHNVGATNVARLCGVPWGVLTLACDLLKGFIPAAMVAAIPEDSGYAWGFAPMLTAMASVIGHMFPVFLRFRGGKGVATTVGVFLALAPIQLIIAAAACVLVIWRTRFVSAGSLTLISVLPILFALGGNWPMLVCSLVLGTLIAVAHRENIRRLLRGEEKPWLSASSPKPSSNS